MLADYGFKVSENYRIVKSIDAAIEYIRDFDSRRKSLAYDTDGAVLKVNAVYQQDILAVTRQAQTVGYRFRQLVLVMGHHNHGLVPTTAEGFYDFPDATAVVRIQPM